MVPGDARRLVANLDGPLRAPVETGQALSAFISPGHFLIGPGNVANRTNLFAYSAAVTLIRGPKSFPKPVDIGDESAPDPSHDIAGDIAFDLFTSAFSFPEDVNDIIKPLFR